ncbi:MAG: extracellular solute-binding protein [Chloroflexi bacterium]|nr:extracellular solute-binding protein [Chloroflexota bacterium]
MNTDRTNPAAHAVTRRRLIRGSITASAGLSGVLLAACGGERQGSPAPGRPSAVQGKVLVLSYQTSSPRWDMQLKLYEEFNEKHRGQGLQVEFVNPGQAVMEKARTLHVAGTPADMFEWPRLWRELEDFIVDPTPYFKRDKLDLNNWIPTAMERLRQGDKVWGLPVSISADAMAVNLDLFAAAGLQPPPQDPDDRSWTMDKFLDVARKLTRGTEQFGFGGGIAGFSAWLIGPNYFGYGPVDLRNRKITMNTPGFRQGLQYWVDMRNRHHLQPVGDEVNRLRAVPNQHIFLTGKVGMTTIFNLAERPTFRWAVAALPYTPNAQEPRNVSARISVHALFIDGASKNRDQAWEVFKYWMQPENNARYVLSDGHVVSPLLKGRSDLAERDFRDRMGVDPKVFFLQAQRSRENGWGYFLLKDWAKAYAEINPLWNTEGLPGQISVGEFASRAQETHERLTSF